MKKILALGLSICAFSTGVYAANVPDDYGGRVNYAPSGKDEVAKQDIIEPANKSEEGKPVRLTADKVEYNEETGDFYAEGNVVVSQNGQVLKSTYAEGNMKNGQVFMKSGGEFIEGTLDMHADWIYYNFLSKSGEIQKIDGCNYAKQEWYNAPDAVVRNGVIYAEHGATMSYCPAKKHPPCMSVEAKTFEIIPNKRMVAKDCWVKIRGAKVYHRARWENDLTKKRQSKFSPKAEYDSDKGLGIGLDYDHPLWSRASINASGRYYSHDSWKYWYGITQDANDFVISYGHGWQDYDGDWYHKNSNWRFDLKRHRIAKGLPLSYSAYLESGIWKRWYRDAKNYSPTSRHTEYGVYLYHDPIHLFNSEKNSLNLYIGKTWTREELTDRRSNTNVYGATFSQKFGNNVSFWIGYYDQRYQDDRIFDIGQPDMAQELRPGLQYTSPNGKDVITAVYRYNIKDGTYNGFNYGHKYSFGVTWLHHFCCWDMQVEYERRYAHQDNRLSISFNFSFF